MKRWWFGIAATMVMTLSMGCQSSPEQSQAGDEEAEEVVERSAVAGDSEAVAVLAGGCFWCMQPPFDALDGVVETQVGYTGGTVDGPTYEQVSSGQTDHVEAVEVRYDPEEVGYDEILDVFWRSIDPTDEGGQFADRGDHYRTAIFVADDREREIAEASREDMDAEGPFDDPIVTEIRDAGDFWVAEDYHQDYYKTNERHYRSYYEGSGRGPFLREVWGEE